MALAVYTTLDDRAAAKALARSAVEKRLAACVHVEEILSVYDWDGLQEDTEIRLMFKTSHAAYDALAAHILAAHPYDEPALWAFEMNRGSPSFLSWIEETAKG